MRVEPWYFVRRNVPIDASDDGECEVQVLDGAGRSDTSIRFRLSDDPQLVSAAVPPEVVRAALTYPPGFGDYVDRRGEPLDLWGAPLPKRSVPSTAAERAEELLAVARRVISQGRAGRQEALAIRDHLLQQYGETSAAESARSLVRDSA